MRTRNRILKTILGQGFAFAKPKPRRLEKARDDRQEAQVAKDVRAACVERDGLCRLTLLLRRFPTCPLEPCRGPSEWAHLEGHRRFETRNRPAEERHSTTWTAMLCQRHHIAYDAHDFYLEQLTERGADDALRLRIGNRIYDEVR